MPISNNTVIINKIIIIKSDKKTRVSIETANLMSN